MPIRLIDTATGKPVDVRDDEVHYAVTSGKFSFEPGADVPIKHPETGEVVSMPSDKVQKYFAGGWDLATPQTISASGDVAREEAWKQATDSPLLAFESGLASGVTGGLGDLALAGAEKTGLLQEGATDFLKQVREASPTATLAGEITGFMAPVGAGAAITNMGAKTAAAAAAKLAPRVAENIVAKAANKAIGSAVEGALISGQQMVTEASLGDPNEVAEHFISNLATGALWGGAIGGAMPIVGAGAKAGRDMVGRGVKKVSGAVGDTFKDVVFKMQGEQGRMAKELLDLPENQYNRAMQLAGKESEKAFKDAGKAVKVLEKEQAQVDKAYAKALKEAGDEAVVSADEFNRLSLAGMSKAAEQSKAAAQAMQEAALVDLGKLTQEPAGLAKRTAEMFDNTIEGLSKGNSAEQAFAGKLAEIRDKTLRPTMTEGIAPTLAADASAAVTARQELGKIQAGLFTKEVKNILYKEINNVLKGDGALSKEVSDILTPRDKVWKTYLDADSAINSMLNQRLKGIGTVTNLTKALKQMDNPEAEAMLLGRMTDLAKSLPKEEGEKIFKLLDGHVLSKAAKQEAARLSENATTLAGKIKSGQATGDDAAAMLREMGVPEGRIAKIDAGKRGQILRDVQAKMGPDASPVDILINVAREAGEEVPKRYAEIAALAPDIAKIEHLRAMAKPQATGVDNLIGGIPGSIAASIGGTAGGALLGPYGAMVGAVGGRAAAGAVSGLFDPLRSVQVFRTLDKVAGGVRNKTYGATEKLITGLTSPGAAKAAITAKTSGSIKERRETYLKQRENMQSSADKIATLKENIQSQIAPSAPGVAASMTQKLDVVHQFLQSKMPVDPLEGTSIFANKTGYVPSDAEMAKWERYVKAVDNPAGVIEDIAEGSPSQEGVEVLKTVYPAMFKQLQSSVLFAIMEQQPTLDYKQRLTLGTLFDIPSDPSLASAFVSTMQGNFVQQNNGEQGGRPPKATTDSKKLAEVASPLTDNQRVQYK
jgi:hypothetical protein